MLVNAARRGMKEDQLTVFLEATPEELQAVRKELEK